MVPSPPVLLSVVFAVLVIACGGNQVDQIVNQSEQLCRQGQRREGHSRHDRPLRSGDAREGLPDYVRRPLPQHRRRAREPGLPSEVALGGSALKDVRDPQLTVLAVEVSGDLALARTRSTASGETAALNTVKLVKADGEWRIASLSEPVG